MADHLSRIPNTPIETIPINEDFPNEHIFMMCKKPWYVDIANYLATGRTPSNWSGQDKHRYMTQKRFFFWDEPYLFKYCPGKLKIRWSGPYIVQTVSPHGAIKIFDPKSGNIFKVNG